MGDVNAKTMSMVGVEQIKNNIKTSILTNILPAALGESAPELCENIMAAVLPTIQEEFTSKLLPALQDLVITVLMPTMESRISTTLNELVRNLHIDIAEEVQRNNYSKRDAENFLQRYSEKFKAWEKYFKESLEKATRLEQLIKLNEEGLKETPVYVPRQYRRDKYHIKSAMELEVLKLGEISQMKSEMEIFKLRVLENLRRMEDLDNEISTFVTRSVQDPLVRAEVLKIWESRKRNRVDICNQYWIKKIISTKKTIAKDKEYIPQHNNTRFKKQPMFQIPTAPPLPVLNIEEDNPELEPEDVEEVTHRIPETQVREAEEEIIEPTDNQQMQNVSSHSATLLEVEPLVADTFDEFEEDELDDISDDEFGDENSSEVLFSEETMIRAIGMANNFETDYEGNFREAYDLRNRPQRESYVAHPNSPNFPSSMINHSSPSLHPNRQVPSNQTQKQKTTQDQSHLLNRRPLVNQGSSTSPRRNTCRRSSNTGTLEIPSKRETRSQSRLEKDRKSSTYQNNNSHSIR